MKRKIIISLLLTAMLLSLLTACGGGTGDDTTAPQAGGDTTAPVTDPIVEKEYEYSGKKYDGAECVVLLAGISTKTDIDFVFDSEAEKVIDQALFSSQSKVEEEYDVTISYVKDTGTGRTGISRINAEYTAGDSDYAFSYIAVYDLMSLANSNCLYDLNSVPGLDLSKSFWDQNANKDFTVNGVTFFANGDISILDDIMQFVIIFNKDQLKETNPDVDIYEDVTSGKWTFDKLSEYSMNFTEDLDGNDALTMEDKFGILLWDDTLYAALNASGERIVDYNEEEEVFELSLYTSERAVNVLTYWFDLQDSEAAINRQRFNQMDGAIGNLAFVEGRALFYLPMMVDLDNIRDMDMDYGILPYPKYDEGQTRYYTTTSAYHMAHICTTNTDVDIDMRGDIMQALAYYRQQELTPAYHEKTLIGKSVRDDESIVSLEILASTRIYDMGFFIKPASINEKLLANFRTGTQSFSNLFASTESEAQSQVDQISQYYQTVVYDWYN